MDAFPDTLPVLDEEQNPHEFNLVHPQMMTTYSNESDPNSNNNKKQRGKNNNNVQDGPSTKDNNNNNHQQAMIEGISINTPPLEADDNNNHNNNNNDGLDYDKQTDSDGDDCEPIPSDEQKLSSHSHSGSLQRMIEQDQLLETPSERAFLQQLSNIALEETNVCYYVYNMCFTNLCPFILYIFIHFYIYARTIVYYHIII